MGEDDHIFGGGTCASWVLSVTTVATPHDGTPLVSVLDSWMGTIFASLGMAAGVAGAADTGASMCRDSWMGTIFASLGMAAGVAGAADTGASASLVPRTQGYDFKLDQWGIEPRRKEEGWAAYSARVRVIIR
ncbi:hypothetical protein T484DRAFT_1789319 [Baffinella frigidus]|nr:hypothetical protein T484DRAFT_1789319 [Cryptophyta sp. CCMP2293]